MVIVLHYRELIKLNWNITFCSNTDISRVLQKLLIINGTAVSRSFILSSAGLFVNIIIFDLSKKKLPGKLAIMLAFSKAVSYYNIVISSNINEVFKAVLSFYFFTKRFHNHKKAQNVYKQTKIKNAPKKHLR